MTTSTRGVCLLACAVTLATAGCVRSGWHGEPDDADPAGAQPLSASATSMAGQGDVAAYFSATFGLTLDNVYWGELHAHSSYSLDAALIGAAAGNKTNDPAAAYAHARDVEQLDFVGLSDHAEEPNPAALPAEHRGMSVWQSQLAIAQAFNDEDASDGRTFVVFAGWEYTNTYGCVQMGKTCGSETGYGHKNVLFRSLDPAQLPPGRYGAGLLTPAPLDTPTAEDLWQRLAGFRPGCDGCEAAAMTVPHTPSMSGQTPMDDHRTDWDTMDSDFVRTVEIYSKWGSSEGPGPLTCQSADDPFDYDPARSTDGLTVRQTLVDRWRRQGDARFRLGFVGGTDTHDGRPANADLQDGGMQYRGGLTGIAAPSPGRADLWSGLWQRHTMAATTSSSHTRVPVLLAVQTREQHLLMGDHGLASSGARLRVLASSTVEQLDVVVDGCQLTTVDGNALDLELDLGPGRHFVYVRARAEIHGEPHVVWTSPVYLGRPR